MTIRENIMRKGLVYVASALLLTAYAVMAAEPQGQVGRTGWDVLHDILNTVPVIVLAVGATAAGCTWLFFKVVAFMRPERVQIAEVSEQVSRLTTMLADNERRYGAQLVLVRALESCLAQCAQTCRECADHVEQAYAKAHHEVTTRGLLLPGDDTTIPTGRNWK